MKILKRNQLIILVISLMLITAGYLNFTTNQESIKTSAIADRDDTTIGDAQFVSTIPHEDENTSIENSINNEEKEDLSPTSSIIENSQNENSKEDYYFITSKLDRNTMYSETLETYQEIYNNSNATSEQKSDAITKINSINNTKNAIMIAENLIVAKGFKDVVIFVNENSISVIVQSDELREEEVAQIQNIVSRELNADAQKIHISNK